MSRLAQRLERGLGAILGFAHHACEIAVAHDGDQAGNGARAILLMSTSFAADISDRSTRPCSMPGSAWS